MFHKLFGKQKEVTLGNKNKVNNKIAIPKCIEYQLKLRELAYNLLNSKSIFELDRNRLAAIKYIYEDELLKLIFEDNLKIFKKIIKQKKYKNAIECIYKNIKSSVNDLAEKNKQHSVYNTNDMNTSVFITNSNNMIFFKYQDIPLLGVFESCLYLTPVLSPATLEVHNSIYSFYEQRGFNVINNIIHPSLFNLLTKESNIEEFNKSVDYIIEESKLEYYLASIGFESEYSVSKFVCNNFSLKFKMEIISTALCQVLLSLEQYVFQNCNITDNKYNTKTKKFKLNYNNDNDTFYIDTNELKLTDAEKETLKETIKPKNQKQHFDKNKHKRNITNINTKIKNIIGLQINTIRSERNKFYEFDANIIQVN